MSNKIIKSYRLNHTLRFHFLVVLLSVFATIHTIHADNIYIDPTYSGGASDGTISSPYTSWSNLPNIESDNSYLQKRGTKDTITSTIEAYRLNDVHFGVYGSGTDYAYIHNSTPDNKATFQISASEHCSVDGFYLTGESYDTQCGVRVTDDGAEYGSTYSGNGTDIRNCYIEHFKWGIRMMKLGNSPFDTVRVENVKINQVYSDGMFIQGWSQTNPLRGVDINNCYIDSTNMAYQITGGGGQDVAEGDGIQISKLVDGWKVRNTTIDRRNSSNKFCLIHRDEGDTKTMSGLVENCTFYTCDIDTGYGGEALYFHALDSIIVRYNKIYVNDMSQAMSTRTNTSLYCYHNTFINIDDTSKPDKMLSIGAGPNYIYNNTFVGAETLLTYAAGAGTTYLSNNIYYDLGAAYGDPVLSVISDYNLFYLSTGGDEEQNSIYDMDPKFTDLANGDFTLQVGSPCINSGKDFGYATDIAGTSLPQGIAVEMGAYEFIPTDLEAPSVPDGLVSSNVTYTSFTVSWNASTDNEGVLGYIVYIDGEQVKFTDQLSIDVSDLTQGTDYIINVKAKDGSGNLSDLSTDYTVTTSSSSDSEAPTVPVGLSADRVGQNSVTISWDASTDNVGVTAYNIYLDGDLLTSIAETTYIITNLIPETEYIINVSANDEVNNVSDLSSDLTITTEALCSGSQDWTNTSFSAQTDAFIAEFDVIPDGDGMDGVVGLSSGDASGFSSLSCIVQYNSDGYIKVRNGGSYESDENVPYYSGMTYHFEMAVSTANQTYDVFVTPENGDRVQLADDYSFRASNSQLDNYAIRALSCTLSVINFEIQDEQEEEVYNGIFIDFGNSTTIDGWNTISSTGINDYANVIDSSGTATDVELSIYDGFAGSNTNGESGLSESLHIPDLASYDHFYGSGSGSIGAFKLKNLTIGKEYTLVFYSSRTYATENRETQFVITGESVNTIAINSAQNTGVLTQKCYPDSNGELDIVVSAGPNNEHTSLYYYLNTLQIYFVDDVATSVPTHASLNGSEVSGQQLLVYPNPAENEINVKVSNKSEMTIFDTTGSALDKIQLDSGLNKIPLNLKSGIYFLQIFDTVESSTTTTKLIVK